HALRALRSGQLTWEQRREQFRPGSVWHTAARILKEQQIAASRYRLLAQEASPTTRANGLHGNMSWDQRRAQYRKKT
ncbi:hypothetical protein ACIRRX_32530, partial [Streptomyces bacillaris]